MTTRQKQIKVKHDELVALLKEEFEEHARASEQDKNYSPKTSVAGLVSVCFYERPEQKGLPIKANAQVTIGGEEEFFNHMVKKSWDNDVKAIIHNMICPTENPFEALFARMRTRN